MSLNNNDGSHPSYQLTTKSVGRQLSRAPRLKLMTNVEAQTRLQLQRRRFSDDLRLECFQRNLNPRTLRVTPMSLTTIQDMSPQASANNTNTGPDFNLRRVSSLRDPEDDKYLKSKMTKKYLSTVYALCYCIFIIVFSLLIFIGDAVIGLNPVPEIYCLLLLCVSFVYLIFLFIRVRQHVLLIKKIAKTKEDRHLEFEKRLSEITMDAIQNGKPINDVNIEFPDYSNIEEEKEEHNYCFVTGRHGEFFYLKIGAAWFCLGLTIHSTLFVCYHTLFLLSDDPLLIKCSSITTLMLEILFPLHAIFNLFFIFKYCNLIINEFRGLARFGLMHSIGTAMSFWIYTIVRETTDAIYIKEHKKSGSFWIENELNVTDPREGVPIIACPGPEALNTVFEHFSPYLYPFIIEFSILMAGIFYMMWSNISKCPRKDETNEEFFEFHDLVPTPHTPLDEPRTSRSYSGVTQRQRSLHETHSQGNNVIYLDCQGANRGVFAAMLLIVATVVTIILLFIAVSEKKYEDIGLAISSIYEIIVLSTMLTTTILAYFQTSKLDIVHHKVSYLDDVLLFIAVPAFMSLTILTLIPAIKNATYLTTISSLLDLSQILVQTPWLIDGLRRCANTVENKRNKPGRALVTFLIGANLTLWFFHTFHVKNVASRDERYDFYGDVPWTILSHLMTPLIMFYRFHSSVCLVDIWKNSYEPNSH
ncbi:proton channel OtopLc-like [Culicoides brevitarsis]|uniref:proton channel OtopLc-like n=1 Tax=Culicoides brevitarsis TaxID=469753 RepID=UPI00307C6429